MSRIYSPDTEKFYEILKKKYEDVNESIMLQIIEDVRKLHMQTFMRHRNERVRMKGYERD